MAAMCLYKTIQSSFVSFSANTPTSIAGCQPLILYNIPAIKLLAEGSIDPLHSVHRMKGCVDRITNLVAFNMGLLQYGRQHLAS